VFIALVLFDSTRGLFEGWLRAALAFASPARARLLGIALVMLQPSLRRCRT
jgi:type IV secretion system protein VirB6